MDRVSPPGGRFRIFREPRATTFRITAESLARQYQRSQPLPAPTGPAPYHLSVEDVLRSANVDPSSLGQKMVFHVVGDTGGVKSPEIQQRVADLMEADYEAADASARPSFLYHLGDVVYYNGEASQYYPQFYEPYVKYHGPVVAIPGNHDGNPISGGDPSLAAFVENFCAASPGHTQEADDAPRDAMTQPNVYWTLESPLLTVVGLYTNVPEGGWLDDQQIAWLGSELKSAPRDRALFVAMHHPIYSADEFHSGSQYMANLLDQAMQSSDRVPDAVFAGHVHDYQRFTRSLNGHDVPYLVAGAGGYWHLHTVMRHEGQRVSVPFQVPGQEDVTLESYCDDHHGYLRLEITADTLKGEYVAAPRPHDPANTPSSVVDRFVLDLKQHKVQTVGTS